MQPQSSSFCIAVLYAATGLALTAAYVLWPPRTGAMIVVTTAQTTSPAFWSVLEGTDGRLIEATSAHTAIVWGSAPDFRAKLHANGALLTLNVNGAFGCGSKKRALFQKEPSHD